MDIDLECLREDLINYFDTTLTYNKMAIIHIIEVENCSDDKLIYIAIQNGFDLNNYTSTKKHM